MPKRILLLLTLLLLSGWVAACAQPTPTPIVAPVPRTITLQAPAEPAVTPTPAQTPAQPATEVPPTRTPPPEPEDIGIDPASISLDDGELAASWQAVFVPATPFDNMHAPGPSGLPAHIQILFDGVTDPRAREPGAPVIYIIPVNAYRQLWEAHDSRFVSDVIRRIADMSFQPPEPPPTRGLPVLPAEETFGVNDFATQLRPASSEATSASKTGFRFVGRFAQDATPLTNEWLRYIYQGLTNDGRYLVAFFFPVRTDALPDAIEEVSQADQDAFNQDGLGYLADKARTLDALPSDAWEPDLAAFDALIASLAIEGMPETGLMQGSWLWVGQRALGSDAPTPVLDPPAYEIAFGEGDVQVRADCKRADGTYAADGGMTGALSLTLNPTTMQICSEDSQADAFLTALSQVDRFAIAPGAHTMQLFLPDGSVMSFAQAE